MIHFIHYRECLSPISQYDVCRVHETNTSAGCVGGRSACGRAVFSVGFMIGRENPQTVRLDDGRVIGIGEARRLSDDVEFGLFWEIWEMLQDDYLRGPAPEKDLFYGAINGLVEGLGDPYSEFSDPREADIFESDLEGKF